MMLILQGTNLCRNAPTSQAIVWFRCRGDRDKERKKEGRREGGVENKRKPSVIGLHLNLPKFNSLMGVGGQTVIINTTHNKTVLGIHIHTALLGDLRQC